MMGEMGELNPKRADASPQEVALETAVAAVPADAPDALAQLTALIERSGDDPQGDVRAALERADAFVAKTGEFNPVSLDVIRTFLSNDAALKKAEEILECRASQSRSTAAERKKHQGEYRQCPHCGGESPSQATFCVICGKKLENRAEHGVAGTAVADDRATSEHRTTSSSIPSGESMLNNAWQFFGSIFHDRIPPDRILHPESYSEQLAQDALFRQAASLKITPEHMFKLAEYSDATDMKLFEFLNGLQEPQQEILKNIWFLTEDAAKQGATALSGDYSKEKFVAWQELKDKIKQEMKKLESTFTPEELRLRMSNLNQLQRRWELTAQTMESLSRNNSQSTTSRWRSLYNWNTLTFSSDELEKVRFSASSWKQKGA
jgi:hypothetical protein